MHFFFWTAVIAGNECKKGLTQEGVERFFISCGIKYLWSKDICDL